MLLKGREILQSGETIRLLGLSILYLKGFLFCFSDFGTLRISLFEEERPALETGRREQFRNRDFGETDGLVPSYEEPGGVDGNRWGA